MKQIKPKYTTLKSGTQICEYGDKMVVYCKGSGATAPPAQKAYSQPNPFKSEPEKPLSAREFLRQQLGLDTIGQSTKKES
jgi:hypothetical protein